MTLSDYLAKNYLTPVKQGTKEKRKKKKKQSTLIKSDVVEWDVDEKVAKDDLIDTDDESDDHLMEKTSLKSKGWKGIGNRAQIKIENDDHLTRSGKAADLICSTDAIPMQRMSNGTKSGLQTAHQVQEDLKLEKENGLIDLGNNDGHDETVYRDSHGRLMDVLKEQEDEKKRQEEEKLHQKRLQKEINSGWVQNSLLREKAGYLNSMASTSLNQYADDKILNQIQKSQDRFNDPAARFLSKKSEKKVEIKDNSLPRYNGSFEPNRFGIPPGALWDGVDRSTGFEKKWLNRQNEVKADKNLRYTMAVDV